MSMTISVNLVFWHISHAYDVLPLKMLCQSVSSSVVETLCSLLLVLMHFNQLPV